MTLEREMHGKEDNNTSLKNKPVLRQHEVQRDSRKKKIYHTHEENDVEKIKQREGR